jgi:prepilin-type N-terminal cleavage/methylation domain-containing protein
VKKIRSSFSSAFTLTELLVVLAIVALLSAMTLPSVTGLLGTGQVDQAANDLSTFTELARTYAMGHHTYVRLAVGQSTDASGRPLLIILNLFSADGTESADMGTAGNWPPLTKPLVLNNFKINNTLNGLNPDTSLDEVPPATSTFGTLSSPVGNLGAISFTSFIEFNPGGEASIMAGNPARYIKLALDQPPPRQGQNPFIIRVSGINGTVQILRKENLAQ